MGGASSSSSALLLFQIRPAVLPTPVKFPVTSTHRQCPVHVQPPRPPPVSPLGGVRHPIPRPRARGGARVTVGIGRTRRAFEATPLRASRSPPLAKVEESKRGAAAAASPLPRLFPCPTRARMRASMIPTQDAKGVMGASLMPASTPSGACQTPSGSTTAYYFAPVQGGRMCLYTGNHGPPLRLTHIWAYLAPNLNFNGETSNW